MEYYIQKLIKIFERQSKKSQVQNSKYLKFFAEIFSKNLGRSWKEIPCNWKDFHFLWPCLVPPEFPIFRNKFWSPLDSEVQPPSLCERGVQNL